MYRTPSVIICEGSYSNFMLAQCVLADQITSLFCRGQFESFRVQMVQRYFCLLKVVTYYQLQAQTSSWFGIFRGKKQDSKTLNGPLYRYVTNLKFSQSNPAETVWGTSGSNGGLRKGRLFRWAKRTRGRQKFQFRYKMSQTLEFLYRFRILKIFPGKETFIPCALLSLYC